MKSENSTMETPQTKEASPRIIAIASQKGGTGKTTTALNLGAIFGMSPKPGRQRTLLIDMDPQSNLSMGLGIEHKNGDPTIYDVLLNPDAGIEMALRATEWPNLDVVPSNLDLTGAEVELAGKANRHLLLRNCIEAVKLAYSYIIIDTPPALGLFTQNALIACSEVIVPLQVQVYALRAIDQLQTTLNVLRKHNNPRLHISGIVCTMYDCRNSLSKAIAETIREEFGDLVFKTIIPMNIALAEAPATGQPIHVYAPGSSGDTAYRKLADEIQS